MNSEELILQAKKQEEFDEIYHNRMQIQASVIDANKMILEAGRAAGKTVWFGKRFINVGYDMPGELSFFAHKTYIALINNIVPNLIAYFKTPHGSQQKPLMTEGKDYVIGEKDLPKHFNHPRYPIENPNHSIVLSNGHHYRLVSSDQPDSVAGANGVHAFIEEMKHNDGGKLKSRIFPALRGGPGSIRQSHYYQGITGVSDTARVDLGEHDWFTEYEKLVDPGLIKEIVTVSMHVNEALYKIELLRRKILETIDAGQIGKFQAKIRKYERRIVYWSPVLRRMRKAAVYYLKASSFVNKDMLGFNYFKTQLDVMDETEFLTAIGNVRPKRVTDLFFTGWDNRVHTFTGAGEESYKYKSIHQFNLKDTFRMTAEYLVHYDPNKPLILGYDPGHFSSIVVGQEGQNVKKEDVIWIIKEFYCWIPKQQGDLARMIYEFFGTVRKNKRIIFYYDRAANKTRVEQDKITTDARLMAAEMKKYGFTVEMKNERQRTIFYYEHFKLLGMILSEKLKAMPRLRVDENECPNLVSSINLAPVERKDGKIALDKTSEKKVALNHQAAMSTQIATALTYLIYGHYSHLLPNEMRKDIDLISHTVV